MRLNCSNVNFLTFSALGQGQVCGLFVNNIFNNFDAAYGQTQLNFLKLQL